ncbi:MAG: RNA methyltransferase [Chloroflexi bacterium]|nr:RNA methyltransferase [Chloroflexota bacterium]
MDAISSTRNNRVRYVKSLQTKARLRRGERKLVLEGDRLIEDSLASGGRPTLALYSPKCADYQVIARLQEFNCDLLPVSDEVLAFASDTQQPAGIVAVFAIPKPAIPQPASRALILDAVREPGNLGAILRSAAAAGVELAILAPGCVDPYNPKVLRAGTGAHFRIPVVEASWSEISSFCQDLTVYAASAASATEYTAVDWRREWALILGNEARGLSHKALNAAQEVIAVPMAGAAESLNVASAAAVILFEARRQRRSADSAK